MSYGLMGEWDNRMDHREPVVILPLTSRGFCVWIYFVIVFKTTEREWYNLIGNDDYGPAALTIQPRHCNIIMWYNISYDVIYEPVFYRDSYYYYYYYPFADTSWRTITAVGECSVINLIERLEGKPLKW